MGIIIDSKQVEINTLFGAGEHEFPINNSILMQVQVRATNNNTTFDAYVKDVNGVEVYRSNNNLGLLNELLNYPVYSNQVIGIENASSDEAFSVILNYRRS